MSSTTILQPLPDLPAAIYLRVSTKEQNDQGFSIPTQREECQALAARESYTVPPESIFVDDYTGLSLNRPALPKLRDLVQARAIHAVSFMTWTVCRANWRINSS